MLALVFAETPVTFYHLTFSYIVFKDILLSLLIFLYPSLIFLLVFFPLHLLFLYPPPFDSLATFYSLSLIFTFILLAHLVFLVICLCLYLSVSLSSIFFYYFCLSISSYFISLLLYHPLFPSFFFPWMALQLSLSTFI